MHNGGCSREDFTLLLTLITAGWTYPMPVALGVVLVLLCALWVVVTFILDGILRDLLPEAAERVYDLIGTINNAIVRVISNFLFGLNKQKVPTIGANGATEEEWNGRVKYLETVLERLVAETKVELKSEILEMRTVSVPLNHSRY